jgi:hypothetical protein
MKNLLWWAQRLAEAAPHRFTWWYWPKDGMWGIKDNQRGSGLSDWGTYAEKERAAEIARSGETYEDFTTAEFCWKFIGPLLDDLQLSPPSVLTTLEQTRYLCRGQVAGCPQCLSFCGDSDCVKQNTWLEAAFEAVCSHFERTKP